MGCRVPNVDDMMSLCIRQKEVFRKARRIRRIQTKENNFDNNAKRSLNVIKFEFESNFSISHLFLVECKSYQCLYCLDDTDLF